MHNDGEYMKFSRPRKKPLIALLVKRTVFFFFFFSLMIIMLYIVGTFQEFMESTQLILLRFLVVMSIFLSIGALYGSILDAGFFIIKRQRQFLLGIIFYFLMIIFGVCISLIASFLLVLVGGNVV
jgi:hypothetical protein